MKRIQRKRTKGYKLPANALYVGRPTKWGNPYTVQSVGMTQYAVFEWDNMVGAKTRSRADALAECLRLYRLWAELQIHIDGASWLEPLRGKDLACWCGESDACHADILLEFLGESAQ